MKGYYWKSLAVQNALGVNSDLTVFHSYLIEILINQQMGRKGLCRVQGFIGVCLEGFSRVQYNANDMKVTRVILKKSLTCFQCFESSTLHNFMHDYYPHENLRASICTLQ